MPDLEDLADGGWDDIYTQIARELLENPNALTNAALYNKTAEKLMDGIFAGLNGTDFAESDSRSGLLKAFKTNIKAFAYAKTLTQFKHFKDNMFDENGTILSADKVKKMVADQGSIFNNQYLKVEHQFVTQSAIMADKWNNLDSEYLEFSTVGDSRVRPEHKLFDKFTALKTDAIWRRLYTPLNWNCRCTIVPGIAKNVSKEYDSAWANKTVDPMIKGTIFDNNVGISNVIFNDKHPYFKTPETKETNNPNFINTKKELINRLVKGNVEVKRKELAKPILFTGKGVKEAVNQPHEFITDKNKMLLSIDKVLKKATYLGSEPDYKKNPMVKQIHVFETEVKGVRTFLINRELKTGEIHFYSVSDGENVIKDIKK